MLIVGDYAVHQWSHQTVVFDIYLVLIEFLGEVDKHLKVARKRCDVQWCLTSVVRHRSIS
jgi:hypothetical protein